VLDSSTIGSNKSAAEVVQFEDLTLRIMLAAGLLLMPFPVAAHHGDAAATMKTVCHHGTIVEIKMTNPHSILVFDATDAGARSCGGRPK